MEETVFDIFSSAKNLLYLGNYNQSIEELSSLDINEEDLYQVIKNKFYLFLSYIEENKQEELNDLLGELKESKDQLKIYFNIFKLFTVYKIKKGFNENVFNKIYTDLINLEKFSSILQPAIYLISLMLLEKGENESFLKLTDKFDNDMEILLLRFIYFFKIGRINKMEMIINSMNLKESDSQITQICSIILALYRSNDFEFAINSLTEIKNNTKVSPKLFNFIGLTLMFKGNYADAVKPLKFGIEVCQNHGLSGRDYSPMLVNLINCYKHIGSDEKVRDTEEILRNSEPDCAYFQKIKEFDTIFNELLSVKD